MEPWIFLLVLAGVGVYLLYLLRHAGRRQATLLGLNVVAKQAESVEFNQVLPLPEPKPLTPAPVSDDSPKLAVKTLAITPPIPALPLPSVERRQSKKKPPKKQAPSCASRTPGADRLQNALSLLKQPDGLMSAWLLGEILRTPRSRRPR